MTNSKGTIYMSNQDITYFKIVLAGIKVEIECKYRIVLAQCRDYLEEFDEPDIVVQASQEDIEALRMKTSEKEKSITGIAFRYADEYTEPLVIYRHIAERIIPYNVFMAHGAVVCSDNQAYLFLAPSGVGKSTRAKLWVNEYSNSFIVNGDKPFIKITPTEVIACGTPWCGKEGWNTNVMVPLRAIFLLERADEGEESHIEEVSLGKAFPILWHQTFHPEDPNLMRKTLSLLKSLEGKVKIYKFRSTPTADSVRLAYETAKP